MNGAGWDFTDDGRQYVVTFQSQVNGSTWWLVTREDGKHVSVARSNLAGRARGKQEVNRLALEKFCELKS